MTVNVFKPFYARLFIGTPLIPSAYPVTLDGLLYYKLAEIYGLDPEQDSDAILSLLDGVLDAVYIDDAHAKIYKASQGVFIRSAFSPILSCQVSHPTFMPWQDYAHPAKRKTLVLKTGRYRARCTKNNAVRVSAIDFFGCGDLDKCQFLLEQVFALGRNHNLGFGEVLSVAFEPLEEDLSLISCDFIPMRTLPKSFVEKHGLQTSNCLLESAKLQPPFHQQGGATTLCYVPMQKTQIVF